MVIEDARKRNNLSPESHGFIDLIRMILQRKPPLVFTRVEEMPIVGRKTNGRPSMLILILLAVGSCAATYNILTMVLHNTASHSSGNLSFDPIFEMPLNVRKSKSGSPYHIALTATDSPYSRWQSRIMYYWYKKKKDLPGSDMGGFTRILHSGNPDNLMDEIPTVVVDPLPAGLDRVSVLKCSFA